MLPFLALVNYSTEWTEAICSWDHILGLVAGTGGGQGRRSARRGMLCWLDSTSPEP